MPNPNGQCLTCPTRLLCLGAGLEADGLRELGECMHPTAPQHKGEYLYRSGDPANGCYIVRSGVYKTFAINAGGEEYVTGFFYPGEVLGLPGLARGSHEESAIAIDTGTACRLKTEMLPALWSLGGGDSLLRMLGEHDRQATIARISLSQSRADCRVARFLLELSDRMVTQGRDPLVLPVPMSRTDLASYLGMTLESLSRVVSRLTRTGLITATRSQVTVLAPEQLRTVAHQLAD